MQQSGVISLLYHVTVSLVSCCSTWAVWRLPDHWQTSWPLTWACRKTPPVTLHFVAYYLPCMAISASNRWIYMYTVGEACWWTIHPASKQRSEGEKVRVGDDLILVSVSSERYLVTTILFTYILTQLISWSLTNSGTFQHLSYASGDLMVDASFMQTLWTMTPVMSGCELAEGL